MEQAELEQIIEQARLDRLTKLELHDRFSVRVAFRRKGEASAKAEATPTPTAVLGIDR